VPQENADEIQEISKEIDLKDLNLVYANTMDDVLAAAFAKSPLLKGNVAKPVAKKTTKKK
jgi:ATP-dependent Lon protease